MGALASSGPIHGLSPSQVEETLDLLQRACRTFRPKPAIKRLYIGLHVIVYANLITFVWVLGALLWDLYAGHGQPGIMDSVGLLLLAATTILAPILLLANFGMIAHVWRQRVTLRRLGLKDASISLWKQHRKAPWWNRALATFILVVGLFIFVLSAISILATFVPLPDLPSDARIAVRLAAFLMLATGVTFVALYFLRREHERLDIVAEATEVERALRKQRRQAGDGGAIDVPQQLLQTAARIESAEIAHQRAVAIAESHQARDDSYAVTMTRGNFAQKAALDPQSRGRAEELIERLAGNPRPADAAKDQQDAHWHLKSADGLVEISYDIDEQQRKVQVISVFGTGSRDSFTPAAAR